jgi:hypothetical protein
LDEPGKIGIAGKYRVLDDRRRSGATEKRTPRMARCERIGIVRNRATEESQSKCGHRLWHDLETECFYCVVEEADAQPLPEGDNSVETGEVLIVAFYKIVSRTCAAISNERKRAACS